MRGFRGFRRSFALVGVGVLASMTLGTLPAQADTAPVDPALPTTVTADALPTVQINGVVWNQQIVGNTVYVAGNFTSARPAGSPRGTNEVPRSHMLAYNLQTGALISGFAPTFNGQVKDLALSPDGQTLYAGGQFTSVNGQNRYRVAAFDVATGALTTFRPTVNASINAIGATSTAVFFGGSVTNVNGVTRTKVAAVSAATGATLPFNADIPSGTLQALTVAPDQASIIIAGSFTSVNGSSDPGYGLARLDAGTGANLPLPINSVARNAGNNAAMLSLESDGEFFYGTGFHFGGAGNVEGTFKGDWATGNLVWIEDCHGDTYSAFPAGDAVYQASHKHYCANTPGGFPQTDPWSYYRGTAVTKAVMGVNKPDIYGYPDHPGEPAPQFLNWYPDLNAGTFTGKTQGPWTVSGNDDYVLMGGEFTQVNGVGQEGLVRFATSAIAPDLQGPRLSGPSFPLGAASFATGTVRLSWRTNWDRDNQTLTYRIYRGSLDSTPIFEQDVTASFFDVQQMGFMDTGLTAGSNQRYRLVATDPFGNIARSEWVNVTVSADGELSDYAQTVLDDGPLSFWRLGESSGPAVFDWAGWSDATASAGVTRGVDGAIGSDANDAAGFSGAADGLVATGTRIDGPQTFAIEAWFRTTTTAGGKIVGFGNSNTGNSTNYDRHVYMEPSGQVTFGVYPGGVRTVTSGSTYNDGQWHQVVASMGPEGMKLYVDGSRVAQRADTTSAQGYAGYWRIGGDSPWSGAAYFAGDIDDVAIYPAPLSALQVDEHFVASGRTSTINPSPTDAYGAAVYADQPDLFWRLGESSGTTAADAGIANTAGTYSGGVTQGALGALATTDNTAATFNGANGLVVSNTPFTNPTVYTEELWFTTTTTTGGKLIGFGNATSGLSSNYDRHVYMENSGQLTFGVWTGFTNTATTPAAYNDGQWHHMVATQSGDGMRLYVDGTLQATNGQTQAQSYTGRWRIGGDNTWGPQPWFGGTLDEVAVYSFALSPAQVAQHYALGTDTPPPNQVPIASFVATPTELSVVVDASGSADPDGTVESYAWDFGDGGLATGVAASHSYAAGGTYTVTLTVTDDDGDTGTTTQDVTVTAPPPNQVPVAAFTATPSGLSVQVDGSASADPDGTVASYGWDFGDGSVATGATASHTYAAGGTYTVTLTVTDDDGDPGTTTQDVTVTPPPPNQAPVAAFTATPSGLSVQVDGSASSDADGTVASYAWDFGDGATATGATSSHAYAVEGTYTVTLTVTDDDGEPTSITHDVTVVTPPAETALARDPFTRTTANGWGSAQVGGAWTSSGVASRISVDGQVGRHSVLAGATLGTSLGGISSTSTEVQVVVSADKVPTGGGAFVTVQGRRVGSDAYAARIRLQADGSVQLHVTRNGTPVNGGVVSGLTFAAGDDLQVRLQVEGTSPTAVRAKVWKVGATEPATWRASMTDTTASLQSAGGVGVTSYLFGSATNAPVLVTYDDLWAGAVGTTPGPPPPNQPPVAAFTATPAGLTVDVDGSGSTDADGTLVGYQWDFGDGATASTPVASHTYAAAGTYAVSLTVTDDDGAPHQVTQDVAVTEPPPNQVPVAAFVATPTGSSVSVDGSGSSDPDGTIASYVWDFGDGGAGSGVTASHGYAAAGTFTVTLTVTDNGGETATTSQPVTVTDPPADDAVGRDDFARTLAGGWGVAQVGGGWTSSGVASRISVDGQAGSHSMVAGSTLGSYLADVSSTTTEVLVTVGADKVPTGGGAFVTIDGRRVGTEAYSARLRLQADGSVQLHVARNGTPVNGGVVSGLTFAAGDRLQVRLQVEGMSPTAVRAKVWKVGEAEPAAWRASMTDATASLQAPGGLGITTYLFGSATNAPVLFTYDDLWAGPLQ